MDIVTAKALVSATLVFAIAVFTLVSAQALVTQVAADLRTARVRRGRPDRAGR